MSRSIWSCALSVLGQPVVFLVGDRLQPFVVDVLARGDEGEVGEPRIALRPGPMLRARGDADHRAGDHAHRFLALGLVPAGAAPAGAPLNATARRAGREGPGG